MGPPGQAAAPLVALVIAAQHVVVVGLDALVPAMVTAATVITFLLGFIAGQLIRIRRALERRQ